LAQGLAETNAAIALASSSGSAGQQPNQLLDERDETLRKLAEYISISVVENPNNGIVDVYFGKGEPLVLGTIPTELRAIPNPKDGTYLDVAMVVNGREQNVTSNLAGGSIGGVVRFREDQLSQAINSLGRIALSVAETINDQHSKGMDLESNLGGLFFGDINDQTVARQRVIANSGNVAPFDQELRLNIIDSSQLTTDSYELRFEGPANSDYVIINLASDETVFKSTLTNVLPARVDIDGFELEFESGTFKIGDRFTLHPTKMGASDMVQVVDRVEEIALAAPVRAQSSLGNTGNAQISLGEILDVNSPLTNQILPQFAVPGELTPPLAVRFIADNYYEVLDVTDPANPQPLNPPINNQFYEQGLSNALFSSDPGATIVSASGPDTQVVPAPAPSAGVLVNGYGAQTLTIQSRDLESGIVTAQTVNIAANSSAKAIATSLTAVPGIEANAYTQVRLSNFVDDGDPTPLGLEINGEVITVAPPAIFGPVELAEAINTNPNLQDFSIFAVSDGVNLEIRSFTGEDIEVAVTGAGDSIDVSRIDPYAPGSPVLSTQTVGSGQGVVVGGNLDVTLAQGLSFTSSVSSVFNLAPTAVSAYLGFQFEIQGEAKKGDEYTIFYNTDGVSDNRNALALGELETAGSLSGGLVSYAESYSQIVEEIGTVTNRTRLEVDSAKALLDQTTSFRDAISAVSLDEEAGKLIQFQAAYNASAQVVSVARDLFDTLLNAFR
jgi:flagellar hook-associated protein 1 FlgK